MNKRLEVAVKEFLRLVVLALPAVAIQVLTNDPFATTVYGGLILGVLKSWDRSIHEDETESNGILPF